MRWFARFDQMKFLGGVLDDWVKEFCTTQGFQAVGLEGFLDGTSHVNQEDHACCELFKVLVWDSAPMGESLTASQNMPAGADSAFVVGFAGAETLVILARFDVHEMLEILAAGARHEVE